MHFYSFIEDLIRIFLWNPTVANQFLFVQNIQEQKKTTFAPFTAVRINVIPLGTGRGSSGVTQGISFVQVVS